MQCDAQELNLFICFLSKKDLFYFSSIAILLQWK